MKTLVLALIFLGLMSCSSDSASIDDPNENTSYPQKWVLVQMSGSFFNSQTTGEDMDWQEFYILQNDRTFTKSRTFEGRVLEASGTYQFLETGSEKQLELTYKSESTLIGNCSPELNELLIITSPTSISNTWSACDGPGLKYELASLN